MLELLSDPDAWIAFITLTALEVVLGIDNIVFITVLAQKLPPEQQARARRIGLLLAMLFRIALLFSLAWVIGLTAPLFEVQGFEVSGRDLVLLIGGLFLLAKATHEIHESLEAPEGHASKKVHAKMGAILVQIVMLDIVFSLDSVITAVGMTDLLPVMVAAVVVAVGMMLVAAGPIAGFVSRHPTVKMLALSFLVLIGVLLVAESFGQHIPKGYVYFAMAFALGVEMLNLRMRKARQPVDLHRRYSADAGATTDAAAPGSPRTP